MNDISKEFENMFSAWEEKKITDDEFKEFGKEYKRKLSLVKNLFSEEYAYFTD